MFKIIKPIQQYIIPTIGISFLAVCGINPEKTITSIVFKVIKFFNADKNMNDLNFINSPYIQFILIASAVVWLFIRIEKHVNTKPYTQQKIPSIQDKTSNTIFNNLLIEEDIKYIIGNGFSYDKKLKEFKYYINLYTALYSDSDNFSKYTPVYIYSLPKSTKSIRIKFSNIFYKNDNQLHNLIYLPQYKIYVKSNNRKYLVDKSDGEVAIPLMHHDLHPLLEMGADGKDFCKLLEFIIEIDDTLQKIENTVIENEMQNNYGWETFEPNLKYLQIDLLSFTV